MKTTRVVFAVVAMLMLLAGMCVAQPEEADEIKQTISEFVAAAKAGDGDAAGEYLHESVVFVADLEKGAEGRDSVIAGIKEESAPAGITVGEYEPEILGDVAIAHVPLGTLFDEVPELEAEAVFVLLREADAWRIVGMCLLTPNLMDVLPAEATAQFEPIMNGLADLEADMDEVYATGGLDELLDLCDEEAIFVTDTDMDGSAEVITAGALGDMIMGAGPIPLRQPEGAERVTLTGLGGAVLMTDATVATDMGTLLFRHVLIGVYKPEVDVWKIVLAVGAPLEE